MAEHMGMTGGFVDLLDAPIWIIRSVRKMNLKQLPHYKNYISGFVILSPEIGFKQINHTQYAGIGFRCIFRILFNLFLKPNSYEY